MALEFNEQLSRLQKPDRAEMTDEEYAVFAKNVEVKLENLDDIDIDTLTHINEIAKKMHILLKEKLNKQDAVLLKASNSLNFTEICEAIC